jgi:hypothetical protein
VSYPSVLKTYLFIANAAPSINVGYGGTGATATDANDLALKLKNILKGFASSPWTIAYSCNGTTAGTAGDGVDRWSASADIVHAAGGVAHSWMVLKQTGISANFQLLIDFNTATSYQASISCSPSAGFTGGSTTAAPTATDQCPLNNAAIGTASNWGPHSGSHSGTLHVIQSTDGSCLRAIICSSGMAMGAWLLGVPQQVPAGWTNPFIGWVFSSGTNASEGVLYANITRTANARARVSSSNFAAYLTTEGCNASEMGAQLTGPNDIDASYPMAGIGIVSTTTVGTRGRLGSLTDVWAGLVTLSTASTYGTKAFAQFGDLIFAWDGLTTPSAS